MERKEIIDAYVFLREHNNSIPSNTLEFIKDAALCAFDALSDDYCKKCKYNGNQMIRNTACTGCGCDGEKLHFKMAPV